MTAITGQMIETVAQVLSNEGADTESGWHEWRCFDKDRCPEPCSCTEEVSRAVLEAVAPLIAAQALRDVTHNILNEIHSERRRQHELHGDQTHLPLGTVNNRHSRKKVDAARYRYEKAASEGALTFRHILVEEFQEAMAETDPERLRAELIQVAAVCAQMVEAIDKGGQTDG